MPGGYNFYPALPLSLSFFKTPLLNKWAQANNRCLPLTGGLALEVRPYVPLFTLQVKNKQGHEQCRNIYFSQDRSIHFAEGLDKW